MSMTLPNGTCARRSNPTALDLAIHIGGVARVVEDLAVFEADPVERRDGPEVDVVGELAARERPKILEELRCGDDGGAPVEGEAVLPVDVGAPPGCVELLHDRDAVAARPEPYGGRETPKAAPDHDRVRATVAPGVGGIRVRRPVHVQSFFFETSALSIARISLRRDSFTAPEVETLTTPSRPITTTLLVPFSRP
jgi:hypothetical protein